MAYTPSATDVTNPIANSVKAATAAAEFQAIKLYMRDVLLAGLTAKAPLASPAFTGTPTAPTAAPGTNTTQLATTAFVKAAVDSLGTVASSVANSLTPGSYLTGSAFNGSAARTFAVDATTTNTASKVVARDASGNFSAGTITANLVGNVTGALTGNAATASSVPWSGVSGTPTTMAGYGISDGLALSTADARYPQFSGTGATGTWGISVTGSAGSVTWANVSGRPTLLSSFTNDINSTLTPTWANVSGKPSIVNETANSSAVASTLVKRDGSANVYGNYFNQGSALETPSIGAVIVENSAADGFFRKTSMANFNAAISPAWSNVTGKPTAVSAWTNDAGYVTSTSLSSTLTGYAGLSSSPTFTGMVKGNNGSKGLGAITTTTTTGTPTGGSSGDLVLVY